MTAADASRDGPAGPSSGQPPLLAVRLLVGALGVSDLLTGLVVAVDSVPVRQWPSALVWLAAGVVVHDAVLAPLAVALGLGVLPRVPAVWRGPLRGGLLGAGVLALLSVVMLGAAPRRSTWSLIPTEPSIAILVAVVVLVGAVLAGAGFSALSARRGARRDR